MFKTVQKKQANIYDAVDIVKLLFAFCVVFIHVSLKKYNWPYVEFLCNLAVPYFFIASGFFFRKKIETNSDKYTRKYVLKILKMYIVFSLILILINIKELSNVIEILKKVRIFLFIGDIHLWYLLYTIYVVIFISIIRKSKKYTYKKQLFFSVLLFIVSLFIQENSQNSLLFSKINNLHYIIFGERYAFSTALLCFTLGMYSNERNILSKYLYFTFILALMIIAININIMCIKNLIYIITSYMFFKIIKEINLKIPKIKIIRKLSTSVYLVHIPILLIILKVKNTEYCNDNNIIAYLGVLIISLMISLIYMFLLNRKEKKDEKSKSTLFCR